MSPPPDTAERAAGSNACGPPQVEARGSESDAPTPSPQRRVLVVDDEQNVLTSLRRLLRREPYELVAAGSAQEALRVLEEQPAQLIISDQRMPEMTGTELLREVRRRWPDTVRVILSGYSAVQTIIEAINEGAVYKFLSKPWNDEELKVNIRRALEQYELEGENRRLARELGEQNERLRQANELLDQRAADAAAGLASVQDILEVIGAGVLAFDESGLIVGANQVASELVSATPVPLIGMDAKMVLPENLYGALCAGSVRADACTSGRVECQGRVLQYRLRPVGDEDNCRGTVATLWEEVP